ncbi:putative siderophore-dependent iron transporter [Piedraia hortae CBS 480.64]|uniref:Putative siderophore-dependent iron transporter n=1 Tax=Piedraia hortae CBS 480.64 TaxID=1314780 RepID=A0A6A7BQX4_9PEZI|nr:putative siderophore-dependent iron transporter [Piedraia hortae CBS 480.64]
MARSWTKTDLFAAYVGIALLTWATSLETQTTTNLTVYATSSFKAHSLISTVLVVQGVVLAVVKPPMSKIADVFGRFEAFSLAVAIYVVGYIMQASASHMSTYAVAQIFYSAGQTGLQILVQIFIADTSDLLNRALVVTLPDVPFLVTVWMGPTLADVMLRRLNWRWGYGIWAILLPVAYLPVAVALFTAQKRAAQRGLLYGISAKSSSRWQAAMNIWWGMDVVGLLLICVGCSLVLIPLTVNRETGWSHPSLLTMFVLGAACLVGFPFWESNKKLAPQAFFPSTLLRNRTVLAGLAFAFFYFGAFYLSVYPYFQSYLLVVHHMSVAGAGRVVQTFTLSATISSIVASMAIKHTKRYRRFVTAGTILYLAGIASMFFLRTERSSLVTIVVSQCLMGIGGGLAHGPAQLGVQASARHQEVAAATTAFLTFLEIGGAVGSAISGAIWSNNLPRSLQHYLPAETKAQATAIYGSVKLAAQGWPRGSPTQVAISHAYQDTIRQILLVSMCLCVPCVLLSMIMVDHKLDQIHQVRGVVIGNSHNDTDDSLLNDDE